VWKQRHTGSNVVDALVRLLRKKLGPHAADIETVKGHGFRIAPALRNND
jgi:DNA-binding response OmpR family regulator